MVDPTPHEEPRSLLVGRPLRLSRPYEALCVSRWARIPVSRAISSRSSAMSPRVAVCASVSVSRTCPISHEANVAVMTPSRVTLAVCMALDSLQPGNALIKVATQGSMDQQPAAATRLRHAALYATGRVYFPRRHYAIALVSMYGAREPNVVGSVRRFSFLGIWVRPSYEGRQAQVAPQIRLRLPAGFADRRKSGSLSD
jgi:hypothetical protein